MPESAPSRAVVDTNVWVSAVLNPEGEPARILAAFRQGAFEAVTSEPLLDELVEVLARPRIARKYGILVRDASELVALIRAKSLVVEVSGGIRLCRDPDDDVVLETAIVGACAFVVSRDEDLTRVDDLAEALRERGVELATVRRFLEELGRQSFG